MLGFVNTYLNSLQYSHENDENNRMKGGFPMNEYKNADDSGNMDTIPNNNDSGNNNIIYGGDDGLFQMQEESNVMEGGSFVVPLGLVYFPPPLCDYENHENKNTNRVSSEEDIPVISDKLFDSLFALVSSNQKKSNLKSSSSRKLKRRNPLIKTKKNKK